MGLLWLLVFHLPVGAAESRWIARVWQSDEGLPDNTVVAVQQSPDGFLWVATQAGLVRFDGIQFRQFEQANRVGNPSSLMQAMMVDRKGRLWIAKDRRAVICVDHGQAKAIPFDPGLANQETRMMVEDSEGAIWVTYIGGDVIRILAGRVQTYSVKEGLSGGSTCQLATDSKGQLWYSESGSLGVLRSGKFVESSKFRAQRIIGCRTGGIWICTGRQLYKCQEGAPPVSIGELPDPGRDVNPTVLYEDRSGALWIGTREAGLFRFDGKTFETVITSHQEILSLMEDRDGTIFVGTRGGGLNHVKPRVVELLAVDPAVPFEGVRSVCQDKNGLIWMVSRNGDVWRGNGSGSGWTKLGTQDGWSARYALCIAADPQGGVWIGTQYSGLYHWREGVVTLNRNRLNGLRGDLVGVLLTLGNGDVWAGTESVDGQVHTLEKQTRGTNQSFTLPTGSGPLVALSMDAGGDCWGATSDGFLLRIHGTQLTDETRNTLPGLPSIRCLFVGSDDSLWIGYAGEGVGRLKRGRFTHYRQEQGLHDDYLSQMIEDGRGRLWFAGNRGIFHLPLAELDEVASGRPMRLHSVAYGQNEGLPRLQASHDFWPGSLRAADGTLWMAMQSGLARVHASNLTETQSPPRVLIEGVRVNGKPVANYVAGQMEALPNDSVLLDSRPGEPQLRLLNGNRQIDFNFTALNFVMPENIAFRYRLEGHDWVDAGTQRVASYPQLPPGNYRFQVTACNLDGRWNDTGASLAFSVVPYWWETTWFRVAGPVGLFGLIGAGVLVSVRRRHRRQIEHLELLQATDRERTRIAQDLHDDLGAGLTHISLNTAMVQNPAVSAEVAAGMLQEIEHRSRELVAALDEIVWAVNPRNDTVPSLARYLCQYTQNCLQPTEMTCRLEVSATLPDAPVGAEQRHQLFLAFKEGLHNALKHSGAAELRLSVLAEGQNLMVILADNGKGFLPGPTQEGSDGLVNMKTRLERLGGSCVIASVPGTGTRVVFTLPLQPLNS